ncbi:hypothetical protein M569_14514 [Genlisea aurea]|uniref:Uncharacterized protein n=1 Tax=Genlisea aurea TaxID=192259 RepID=S8C7B0_9LAMI|nr:hypothetical protein M569_14514 [Genlisea aurea]
MGRSIQSPQFARIIQSLGQRPRRSAQSKRQSEPVRTLSTPEPPASSGTGRKLRIDARRMDAAAENSENRQQRLPLSEVVADCVKRWFQDTLKEARNGDASMQLLLGQMYYNGYGVARDPQKGRACISRASKNRSSVWKIGDKHPGYNASDSDSDDLKQASK